MKIFFYIAAVLLIFSSCQKELNFETVPVPADTAGTGFSTDTSYQPASAGSFWKYKSNNPDGEITMLTTLGATQSFDGKMFSIFDAAVAGQQAMAAYISKTGGRYEIRDLFNRMGFARPNVTASLVYLIIPAKTGDEWEYDAGIASNRLPAKIRGRVYSTNNRLTVAGRTFTNVIVTKLEVLYKLDNQSGDENYQSYYFYTAKGVGIIRTEAQSTGGGSDLFNAVEELVDFKIN